MCDGPEPFREILSASKFVAAGPVSRILSAGLLRRDGHSSGPRITARLKRPTRRLWRAEPARAPSEARRLPPYLVLLRVGFALPAALLRRRCALTAPFHPYPGVAAEAVCFLWHFPSKPGLNPDLPDVIRHTALRSSDFPPSPLDAARATVRSSCQQVHCNSREAVLGPWSLVVGQRFMAEAPRTATTRANGQRPTTKDQRPLQFGRFLSSFWIFQNALGRRSLTGGSGDSFWCGSVWYQKATLV